MSENNTNPKSIEELYQEGKKLLLLSSDYVRLELAEKLTILISTMILIMTLLVLGMVALFYLSFAIAYKIEPIVGSLTLSFTIITLLVVLLMMGVFFFRKQLIINPLASFLSNLFLKK